MTDDEKDWYETEAAPPVRDDKREHLRIVAAENARAVREDDRRREDEGNAAIMNEFVALAMKATGLTREELLAHPFDEPEPPPRVQGVDRGTLLARGVPELHVRHVYDVAPVTCAALETVQDFLAGEQTLLVLSGGVGTRKSGSACWALTQRAGRYVSAEDLSQLASSREAEDRDAYRQLKKALILVIDDLGGEYLDDKGWFVRALNGLIDARYAACLKTVMTTNLDAGKFKANYGERIADRIREAGRFRDIGGGSARRT